MIRTDFFDKIDIQGKKGGAKMEKCYMAIDLKSFYASVECVERGLNPMTVNLVVADRERTEKTICLAVSPALKSFGIPGRPRLFEVTSEVRRINEKRRLSAPSGRLSGASHNAPELNSNPSLALDYICAPPRMSLYMDYSTRIYEIYLEFISSDDIHVYSVDEVFIDATPYLKLYKLTPEELATKIITEVYKRTGITATCGIGTNLYLCKVAMDIVAKKATPDENGVRIARLDEMSYRRLLWEHEPLTDFWRVGKGYTAKLSRYGIRTMGDIARLSRDEVGEELLFKLFGVNAELLIDHAWGIESCTMRDIKSYRPDNHSLGEGQVLHCAYTKKKARIITHEMIDALSLKLVEGRLVADGITLTIGYDKDSDTFDDVTLDTDFYGRSVPKHAHGTAKIGYHTSSTKILTEATLKLFDRIVDERLLVRRVALTAMNVIGEDEASGRTRQLDFTSLIEDTSDDEEELMRERRLQLALLDIKRKYGKNSIVRGLNLEEGATGMDRNMQIGGHKG